MSNKDIEIKLGRPQRRDQKIKVIKDLRTCQEQHKKAIVSIRLYDTKNNSLNEDIFIRYIFDSINNEKFVFIPSRRSKTKAFRNPNNNTYITPTETLKCSVHEIKHIILHNIIYDNE